MELKMSIDFYKESLATYEEYEIESEKDEEEGYDTVRFPSFNKNLKRSNKRFVYFLPVNLMAVKQLLCLIY